MTKLIVRTAFSIVGSCIAAVAAVQLATATESYNSARSNKSQNRAPLAAEFQQTSAVSAVAITCPSPYAVIVTAPPVWRPHTPDVFRYIELTSVKDGVTCVYGRNGGSITNVRITWKCRSGTSPVLTGLDTATCTPF